MLFEMSSQALDIARVDQIDGPAEDGVLNALVMRQVQSIAGYRLFNAPLEPGPTQKAVFAGDGQLRGAELELGGKNGLVRCAGEARMELADELCRCQACERRELSSGLSPGV